ncbi:hypothetical protein T265_01967 [Opisthorchis viverrini]|uniref:Uncharacterized protein n=1 Tax=Opisthorchis viverrini TaxID=6198 RepID=A0A074ZWP1_OPIVI|nr:hypothetical protein T265_01967 [Opisthorchis viverrini]KER31878.1 hypothetical protein T265_01967 [Opisthorchis viverrini]
MTAVWTAMSLQRRDGGSSSLSRSLGSLISPRLGEDHSTVLLYSNMSPNFVPSSEQRSHWSADEHLGLSAGSARGLSTFEPKLQKITTDSASSIMYLGKRIIREYQCTFVLPDEQQIGATRIETFMPEDGNSCFTLSLSVAAPPEQSMESRSKRPIRQRIEEFLSTADWKSAMLASSESKDAELLGRLSSKYSNSVSRRSRFERSESQKRRHEMVRAREVFSDEEDGVQFSSDEEPALKSGPFPTGSSDGPHVLSPPRTISPDPLVTERITVSHGPLRRPASSAPPIIAHAEPPGRRQAPISDAKSRQKFEELRRTWDERVAREQSFIDEQSFSPALSAHSRATQYIEGHRGAAVTSILPTIPGRKRAPELSHEGMPHTSSSVPTQGSGTVHPVKRFLSGEGTYLPETYKSPSLPESSELVSPRFVTSPALSEPSTERGEKETRFGYNETSVKMNQANVGRLEPRLPARVRYKLTETTQTHQSILEHLSPQDEPHHTSISVHVDSPVRTYVDSKFKQNYIYRTTLARLPVALKHLRSRSHSAHALQTMFSQTTNDNETVLKEYKLSREVTIPLASHSAQLGAETHPRVSKKSFQLSPSNQSIRIPISHFWKDEDSSTQDEGFTVHISDKSSSLQRERLYDQRQFPGSPPPLPTWFTSLLIPRSYHSFPRTRNALVTYPKPGDLEVKPYFKDLGRLRLLKDDGRFHPSPADHRQTKSQSDTDYADFPSADDRSPWFPDQLTVGGTTRQDQHAVPEFPVGYKGYQTSARELWRQRDAEMHPEVEGKESFQRRTTRTHSTPPYSDIEQAKVHPPDRPKSGDGLIEGTYVRHRVKYSNQDNVRSRYPREPHIDKLKTTDFDASQQGIGSNWTSLSAFSVVERLEAGSVTYGQTSKSTPSAVVKLADRKTFDQLQSKTVEPRRELSPAHSRKHGIVRQPNVDENEASNSADKFFAPVPYRSRVPEARKQGADSLRNAEMDRKVHTSYPERTSSRPVKRSTSEKASPAVDSAQLKRDRIRRRKSDLDKHIDEQFDEAYREELIRKESLSAAGSGSREQASMSDLSELASQEAERNSKLARGSLRSRSYTSESGARDVSKHEKRETKGAEPVSPGEYQPQFITGRKRWPPPPVSKGSTAKSTGQTVHPETKLVNRDDALRFYAAEPYKTDREQSGIENEIPRETHTVPPEKAEHADQGRNKRRKANKNESGSDYRELDNAGYRQGLEPSQDDRDKFRTSAEHPSTEDGEVRLNLSPVRRDHPQKGLMVDEDKRTTPHKEGHKQGQPKKDEPFSPSGVVSRGDHIHAGVPQEKTRGDQRPLTHGGKVRDDRDIEPGRHEQPRGEDRVERPKSHTHYGHSREWRDFDRYRTSEIHDKHNQKGRPGGAETDFLFSDNHTSSHGDKTRRKSHDELQSRQEKFSTDEQKLLKADFAVKRDDREKVSKIPKHRGTEDAAERVKSPSTQHSLLHEQRMAGRSGISEDERKQRKETEQKIGVPPTNAVREKHGRLDSSKEKRIEGTTLPAEKLKLQSNLPHGHSEDRSGVKQRLSPGFERPRGDHAGVHRIHAYQGSEDAADYESVPARRSSRPHDQQIADWDRTSKTYEDDERKKGSQRRKELGFPTNASSREKLSRPKSVEMRAKYDQQVPTDGRKPYDKSEFSRGQVYTKGEKSYVPAIGLLHDEKDRVHDGYGQLDTEAVKGRRKSHPTLADRPYVRKVDGDHDTNDLRRHEEDELALPAAEAARNKRERIYSPHKTALEQPMKDNQKLGHSNYALKTEVLSPVEPSSRDRSRSLLSPRPPLMSRPNRTDIVRPLSLPTAGSESFISSPVQLHSRQIMGDKPSEDRLVCMLEQTESEVKDSLRGEQAGDKSMGGEGNEVVLSARSTVAPTYYVEEGAEPNREGVRKSRYLGKESDDLNSEHAPDEAQKLGEKSPPLLPLTGSDLFRRRIGMELGQKHQEATEGRSKHTSYDPMASETGDTNESFPPTGRSTTDPSKRKAQELHDNKPLKSSDLHQKRSSKQVPGETDDSTRRQPLSSALVGDSTRPLGERDPRRGGDDLGSRDQARRQKKERTENGYAGERLTPPDFEERKVASFPTRKRHPPPPTSPTFQPPTGSVRTSDTPGTRQGQRPTGPPHEKYERTSPIQNGRDHPGASKRREMTASGQSDDQQLIDDRGKRGTKLTDRTEAQTDRGLPDSGSGRKQGEAFPIPSEDIVGGFFGPTDGSRRERDVASKKTRETDEQRSGRGSKREPKTRHPPPPEASGRRRESKANGYAGKDKLSSHRRAEQKFIDEDADYVNVPGSTAPGARPREQKSKHKTHESSEHSNEQSSYDPRVTDGMQDLPQSTVVMRRKEKAGEKSQSRPTVSPRKTGISMAQKTPTARPPPPQGYRTTQDDFDEDDDEDLEDSEEELKPPALRSIPQTKKSSDSLVRGSQPEATRGAQLRRSSRPSPHDRVFSPSSTSPRPYIHGGTWDRGSRGVPHGSYRPEQFHPQQYEYERASRPRSKRDTATSDRQGLAGSKHSMIISTKRRTLSGVTGMNPNRVRSSSMNAIWFGDHPVPTSSGAVSPTAPLRLSTIQLQAQAELERRHRSSSRTHSLDRRSTYSVGGTESRLSRGEVEGYEGIGYGYDTRGRLIHGGANLHERAASRRRRLRDGHESLSRVWIPRSDGGSPTRHTNEPLPSEASRLNHHKSNLDESAVAFALRDFTSPGVR